VNLLTEPPRGAARVTGGLLGVAGGEAWRGAPGGFESGGPVTAALLDLCHSYTADEDDLDADSPLDVARRHQGVPATGWLLPVAIARTGSDLTDDTLLLASAAGATPDVLGACLTYVLLASELLAAQPVHRAIELASCKPVGLAVEEATRAATGSQPTRPRLCGIGPIDAVNAGIWALTQTGYRLASLAASLAHWCEPWVAAAAAGLLGLRDGCAAVPAQWYRLVDSAPACMDLAPELLRSVPCADTNRHLTIVTSSLAS
jgi:hypothetical protein